MSAKQDRQGVRTAAQLEQKVGLTKRFAEVMGIATSARNAAEESAKSLEEKLTTEEVFNLLTNNGQAQGLYRGEDGELYINASYIKSGKLIADLIKSGILQSVDGKTLFNLDNGSFVCTAPNSKSVRLHSGSQDFLTKDGQPVMTLTHFASGESGVEGHGGITFYNPATGSYVGRIYGTADDLVIECGPISSRKKVLFSGNVSVGSTFTVSPTTFYDLFAVRLGTADSTEDTVVWLTSLTKMLSLDLSMV